METIVITGANRGIGLGLTRRFLDAGKRVIAACRTPTAARELYALAAGDRLSVQALDVCDAASVAAFADALGIESVDVLINNAGIFGGERQDLESTDYDAWLRTLEVNTIAPFRLTTALLPQLRRSSRPRVITLSSQMGSLGRDSSGYVAYRSSKAAVNKVMQVLALELRGDGIIACPVHPGWVRTDMGGPGADISIEESTTGLVALIESMTMAHSGRFWTWDGREHPW